MAEILQAVLLALVQGLTEFLPISSAAHLILVPRLLGWADQGLAFDVAVHVGSLAAVMAYFRAELRTMATHWWGSIRGGAHTPDSRLAWAVLWGTVPAVAAGLLLKTLVAGELRSSTVIALATLGFGVVLWVADVRGARVRDEYSLSARDILVIGCAQALALIPGTSRSGITMSAALLLGLSRAGAARFSFLLSIPIILAAGGNQTVALLIDRAPIPWAVLVTGTVVAGLSAYLCIALFLKLIERVGMLPFVLYRLALGVALLVYA